MTEQGFAIVSVDGYTLVKKSSRFIPYLNSYHAPSTAYNFTTATAITSQIKFLCRDRSSAQRTRLLHTSHNAIPPQIIRSEQTCPTATDGNHGDYHGNDIARDGICLDRCFPPNFTEQTRCGQDKVVPSACTVQSGRNQRAIRR